MTRLFCPTCKEVRSIAIEGEKTYTLDCAHTRPREIQAKNGNTSFTELPNFAKWYMHNIDRKGLGKTAEELKVTEGGSQSYVEWDEELAGWRKRQQEATKSILARRAGPGMYSADELVNAQERAQENGAN